MATRAKFIYLLGAECQSSATFMAFCRKYFMNLFLQLAKMRAEHTNILLALVEITM